MSTDKKTIDWYNNNAKEYTAHVRNSNGSVYHKYYEKPAMYSLIPNIKNKEVISLGCGSGEDSFHLKSLAAKVSVGIDISSELIKIATSSYPECDFKVMDMENLNFPDSSFDFVYSSLAIHYIEDWKKVLKEVYRILKPNSFFIFSCNHPTRYSMKNFKDELNYGAKFELLKNKKTGEYTITGDYLSRNMVFDILGKDSVNTWSKSFGEISEDISSSGFLIESIVEPKPLKELEAISPEKYKKLNKIPEFVIFRLFKSN